jgi:hypothetical protein
MKKVALILICLVVNKLTLSQTQVYMQAQDLVKEQAQKLGTNCHLDSKRNIYIDDNKVIHIFIFEDGNLLEAGYPTTATEKNKYEVHIYYTKPTDKYRLEYTGGYTPTLNIENSVTNSFVGNKGTIYRIDFAIIGPFTNSVQLTVKKMGKDAKTYTNLISTTIQISKTIHVSIGSALIHTSLKNPGNIRKIPLPTGTDSTLIADDTHGRGMLTLFATFYPSGRNSLMMPEWTFKDRYGIIVGTSFSALSSNLADLYLGGSFDFAIAGSIVAGIHYGRRQMISGVNFKDFKFGESKFSGNLEDKKYMEWDCGFFIGIQVDSRVFKQIFK